MEIREEELETKERIISGAQELFHKYGIRTVTMDDIAKHLGMSKKTIYKYFKDKDDLVITKTINFLEQRARQIEEFQAKAENAIEEMFMSMKATSDLFKQMSPTLFYDMQKQHPAAWQKFREFKEVSIAGRIERNLKRGIEEGLYRKDIHIQTMSRLRCEEIELPMYKDVYDSTKFNITEVQQQILDHFLHGIATLKGHRLINKYKQIQEEE